MHILLVHQAFAALGEPGGTRHHETARYLTGMGHQVTVIAGGVSYLTGQGARGSRWLEKARDEVGVQIWRPFTYGGWHRSFVHRVLSFISFMLSSFFTGLTVPRVDLVWGTSPPLFQALSAWLLARLKGAAFVLEVRDLWPLFAIEVGVLRNSLLIAMSRSLEQFLYQRADWVVVNSPGFIDHVASRGGHPVTLIPNGVEVGMFKADADGAEFRRKHGLGSQFVLLYAGAHGLSNDLEVAIEAAARLPASEVSLVLLGDGKEKANLQSLVESKGLRNVHFLPPIPKRDMPQALAAADACLAILKPIAAYKTTYPNKVFDYMAAGRPVILAIDGVIRQVVAQAKAGIFVAPGDPAALAKAVDDLRADKATARQMGANGRSYVAAHFERGYWAQQLADVFQQAVGEGAADDARP